MKTRLLILTVFLCALCGAASKPLDLLMPVPQAIEQADASYWKAGAVSATLDPAFETLRGALPTGRKGGEPTRLTVVKAEAGYAPAAVRDQAYRLTIAPGNVRIEAEGVAGARYALVTLNQLLALGDGTLPACTITDFPALRMRGLLHDTGRNFQSVALLKEQIDMLARYKHNTFHWHLTDNPGWRLESKKYPQLQAPRAFTRFKGEFYTQAQFKDVVAYAKARGITVIPEFDLPGHTAAFRAAFNLKRMDEPKVRGIIRELIEELCSLVPAEDMPIIHLGSDEVQGHERVPNEWVAEWAATAKAAGRTVMGWNHGIRTGSDDRMIQHLWTGHSKPWLNRPYIDSQNSYYINHVDPFELLCVAAYQKPCRFGPPADGLGALFAAWNDDYAASGHDVVLMNSVYPAIVLLSDNFWRGREKDESSLYARLPHPDDPRFALARDLEARTIAHRDRFFTNLPFPYVAQTDFRWQIIGPFDHGGNLATAFPPEIQGLKPAYTLGGTTYTWQSKPFAQGTLYPQHFWFSASNLVPENKGTLYAAMRIHSPKTQTVGAWIGFTAFSRSDGRVRDGLTPKAGEWSKNHAAIWINGNPVAPPKWKQPGIGGHASKEIPLVDEDYFYRAPSRITLNAGWNTVLLRIPKGKGWKWVATFSPVEATGKGFNAREVPGLRYEAPFTAKP